MQTTPVTEVKTNPNPNSKIFSEKLQDLKAALTALFPGREEQAEAVVLGLATGYPVFLQSPPGTGKTLMVETLSRLVQGSTYFYYLLSRFTEPDELLGPLDIRALREGEYKRITSHKLPEAHIVFLDEIFKASSAIRNTLLDIILNKRIQNGHGSIKLPMKAFYTASNEGPQDEEDAALYDRLVIRSFFSYVSDDVLEEVVLKGVKLSNQPLDNIIAKPVLSLQEVEALQQHVAKTAVTLAQHPQTRKTMVKIVVALRNEGVEFSDRRLVQAFKVLAGLTVSRALPAPGTAEIADTIMYTAPLSPDHVKTVEETLEKIGVYASKQALEQIGTLLKEAENLFKEYDQSKNTETLMAIAQILGQISKQTKEIPKLPKSMVKQIEVLVNKYNEITEKLKQQLFQQQ